MRRKADTRCRDGGQIPGGRASSKVQRKPNNTEKQYLTAGGTTLALLYPDTLLHTASKQETQMKRQQSGFTLVEIAIVLVIIGLLLGGILKGQEMIVQAKVKNSISDFSGVSAAYYGYQDRYRAIPGDDIGANRWTTPAATPGNGDRILTGKYNTVTPG